MRSSKKRYAALLLALLMALGMVATAAPAAVAAEAESAAVSIDHGNDGGVVLFRGRAKIGETWTPDGKGGTCSGFPSGLNFPGIPNDNDPGVVKCYKFKAPEEKAPGNAAAAAFCYAVGIVNGDPEAPTDFPDDNCSIEAHGALKAVAPLTQPHCGISESNGGNGTATVFTDSGPKEVALSNLGWITSAGSVLPVTGNWDAADPAKSKGERKLVALVQASGNTKGPDGLPLAIACLFAKGADAFDVNAIAVLLPVFSGSLPGPLGDKCDEDNVLKHPKKDSCPEPQ